MSFRNGRKVATLAIVLMVSVFSPVSVFAAAPDTTVSGAPTVTPNTSQDQPSSKSTNSKSSGSKPATSTPPVSYTYDASTGRWDSSDWQYDSASGKYVKPSISPATPSTATAPTSGSQSNATSSDNQSNQSTTANTSTQAANNVTSDATTGDATVSGNTTAGNATSGDATVNATLINTVNSILGSSSNQSVAQFTKDINGDVTGDIVLDPLLLKAMLEAKAQDQSNSNTTTVNSNNDLTASNNLTLDATSGNASVDGNTTAGNATSGSASAVANVINILNSMIAAQQSFIGTINIYGNLTGDILIAPDFISQMIANNGSTSDDASLDSTKVDSKDTQSIVNNISTIANSGIANVLGNTNAGDAKSGNASSNVVIFNLSGHQIVAQDSLLVFVNVLGKWVGVIVGAPAGTTAAMIGDDVASNSQPDLVVHSQSLFGITNSITVNAQSGDAAVSNNTNAGDAVSGDATALVNVANIENNAINLSGWFGILFINVFQNWFGSFGIDTPYGNVSGGSTGSAKSHQPIEFRPADPNDRASSSSQYSSTGGGTPATIDQSGLAPLDSDSSAAAPQQSSQVLGVTDKRQTAPQSESMYIIIGGVILLAGLSAIAVKRFV